MKKAPYYNIIMFFPRTYRCCPARLTLREADEVRDRAVLSIHRHRQSSYLLASAY
jgi:hypothetical protein